MNFLKNIADKAKSVTDSPTRTTQNGQNGDSPQEGFICPLCMKDLGDVIQLQVSTNTFLSFAFTFEKSIRKLPPEAFTISPLITFRVFTSPAAVPVNLILSFCFVSF